MGNVKRHASSLIKAQEEEIERLSMEVAECSALYNARTAQLQAMENQIDNLDWKLKQQSKASEEALQASEQGILDLQRRLESTKMAAEEEASKYNDLLRTLEFTKGAAEAVERRLEEAQREKKDLSEQNEWLEQQVKSHLSRYLLSCGAQGGVP
eukprot:Gb_25862 [translate_table: standard]